MTKVTLSYTTFLWPPLKPTRSPNRAAHIWHHGHHFLTDMCLFRSGSRPCPADALVLMNSPDTIRNARGIKGHCWPPLRTCSAPADCMSQKVSSCEAVGPGQPLFAVVTEWEHAVLSLLAPLWGAQSMCYNNKPRNPDHTLPYLKICNENIWSKCIQSGIRAESHALTEFLTVALRHAPSALWIQTSHVLEKKATTRRWEKQIMFMRPACSSCHI